MDELAAFARLLDALRPWRDHLVIVGGWAHRLHRFTPFAGTPSYPAVTTRDADFAFGARDSLTGDIATVLRAAGPSRHRLPARTARRGADKRAQDALYVHDTLELFGGQLTALRALWVTDLLPAWPATTVNRLTRCRLEQHGSVTDVHRAAVRIPQDRTIAPDLLQARCALGLEEIFGD